MARCHWRVVVGVAALQLRRRPEASCGDVNGLIEAHIELVGERIAALNQLQQQLLELRRQCHDDNDVDHCGIIAQLQTSGSVSPPDADSHVGRSHRH